MTSNNPSKDYAGDLSASEAWALLQSEPKAQLVDVRTSAEWNFVGRPDLSNLGREPLLVEWQSFPSGQLNPNFAAEVERAAHVAKDTPLLFLCRSGARSRAAAVAMTAKGFGRAYNIAAGFEGDLDAGNHRATQNGWKAAGLPWKQT